MTGFRPGQGETREGRPGQAIEIYVAPEDDGGGADTLGAAVDEIARLYGMKMAHPAEGLSKSERASAICSLREEMRAHIRALSQRQIAAKRRPQRLTAIQRNDSFRPMI